MFVHLATSLERVTLGGVLIYLMRPVFVLITDITLTYFIAFIFEIHGSIPVAVNTI